MILARLGGSTRILEFARVMGMGWDGMRRTWWVDILLIRWLAIIAAEVFLMAGCVAAEMVQ